MDELHGPPPSDKFILPSTHDDTLFRKFPHLYFHGKLTKVIFKSKR